MEGAAEAREGRERRRDHGCALLRPPRGNALLPSVCIFFQLLRFAFSLNGKYSLLSIAMTEHDLFITFGFITTMVTAAHLWVNGGLS